MTQLREHGMPSALSADPGKDSTSVATIRFAGPFKAGKTAVYTAWNDLMSQGVLVQQVNAAGALVQRWKLDPEEAARLGLASPRGPEEDAEDEVPQPQPEGPEDENGSQE